MANSWNGLLLVNKEAGFTSNDVVAKLRGILKQKKIGHTGTLDPDAVGLLVVCLGNATRAVELLSEHDKEYIALVRLGVITDTQDMTGTILEERDASVVTREKLNEAVQAFRGTYDQIPPMYSAVKVQGRRLYKLAREGKTVERAARAVSIYRLDLLSFNGSQLLLDVSCSKGTYIRTLCNDIGELLGCGGCLSSLRRTEAGVFSVSQANSLEEIIAGKFSLLPTDTLFQKYAALSLKEDDEKRVRNGGTFQSEVQDGLYRLYALSGEFLALGSAENNKIKTVKSFFEV